jgi:hypothetical protein
MMNNHTVDQIKMMNNYLMYQYGTWLCFGLIVTGLMPIQKNDKPSNLKNEKR